MSVPGPAEGLAELDPQREAMSDLFPAPPRALRLFPNRGWWRRMLLRAGPASGAGNGGRRLDKDEMVGAPSAASREPFQPQPERLEVWTALSGS